MSERFDQVVAIMARLRAPGGCPWDRKQTHESLKPYLIEETYEALDTIDRRDFPKLKEELGDVLLQVLFHSQIGTEAGTFTMDEVLEQLGDKLVRRHPHVFGDAATGTPSLNCGRRVFSPPSTIADDESLILLITHTQILRSTGHKMQERTLP